MYEKEVMTLGRWDNFEHLEESLTLDELFALYSAIREREIREFKNTARAMGATIEDEEETQEESPLEKIVRRAAERRGEQAGEARDLSAMGLGYRKV